MAVSPSHCVGPHHTRPSACTAAISAAVRGTVARAHEYLVEHDVVEDRHAAGAQALGDGAGGVARLAHEPGDAVAAEAPQRSPHLDLARPLRRLRRVVHRLEAGRRWEVAGRRRERVTQVGGVADEGDAAVVRDVEPLVSVGRPGVGAVEPAHEPRAARVGTGPETERTVDVQPPGAGGQPVGNRVEGVEGAGVHLARLGAHEHRTVEVREQLGAQTALVVGRHDRDALAAEAHQAERFGQCRVRAGTHHDVDRRGAEQTVGLHVPTGAREQLVTGGGEACGVGDGGAAHEGDGGSGRQAEYVHQPARGEVVQGGGDR